MDRLKPLVAIGMIAAITFVIKKRYLVLLKVQGESMYPTIEPGTFVLAASFKKPDCGDLVVFKEPGDGPFAIKRVIFINNGRYWVEGDNKSRSIDSRNYGWLAKKAKVYKVYFSFSKP